MITIVNASNRRALQRLLATDRAADRRFDRRVRAIVDAVRDGGEPALVRFARRFDGSTGALEIPAEEIRRQADSVPRDVRRAIAQAARNIARVATRRCPGHAHDRRPRRRRSNSASSRSRASAATCRADASRSPPRC